MHFRKQFAFLKTNIGARAFASLLMVAPFSLTNIAKAAGPPSPCATAEKLNYPLSDSAPTIAIWHAAELERDDWQPPSCTGWQATSHSKLIVTLIGSFHFDGTMDDLLGRVGAISTLTDVLFWSATDKRWRPLSNQASALNSPDPKDRRRDFSASDLVKGADVYYWEDDAGMGSTVYRLRVLEKSPERAVISSDNVSPIRSMLLTIFKPGALQSLLIIQHLSPGVFGVYILNRSGEGTSILADGHDASYVNRADALYRQLAGIRSNQEPPASQGNFVNK